MNKKQINAIIINICIAVVAIVCLYILHNITGLNSRLSGVLTTLILLPIIALIIYEIICWSRVGKTRIVKRTPSISTLVLLGEDGRPIRIWDLTGKVGLLIGKSSEDYQVDIDLADTDYHTYIDPEHALLNYQESGWWLQDTSSRNGVSIIRDGKELKPGHNAPAKLEPGDIICVAHYTRIAVS